jgi:hypothetical protein
MIIHKPDPRDGVLKFVARSEDEFRAYLDAAIEAAREPYDRGNALRLDVGKPASWEPGGDDELAEPAPQAAPRPFQGTYKRARDLAGTVFPVSEAVIVAAARKAFISAAWSSCIFVASVILSLDRAPATSPLAQGLRQGRFSGAMA